MIRFPNAKINLGLRILEQREDGFHNIESVFYPVPLHDALEIIPSKSAKHRFNYSGLSIPPSGKNLCEQAVELLSGDYPVPPIELHLHKHIPMESGLGGGSSDAACCLMMLNDLFQFGLQEEELMQYAAELGSDCAFFIRNRPSMASGRGEQLADIDLKLADYYIRIIKPKASVSTAEAYRNLIRDKNLVSPKEVIANSELAEWKDKLANDFENYVFQRFPEIKKIKEELYQQGAVYASMSGSGSAVFGLFDNMPAGPSAYKSTFVWNGKLK